MIRHVVLVRFPPDRSSSERATVMAQLAQLQTSVAGILAFADGPNINQEGHSAGFDHVFIVDFEDEQARDAYIVHPAHVAAASELLRVADGPENILVVDVAVSGSPDQPVDPGRSRRLVP